MYGSIRCRKILSFSRIIINKKFLLKRGTFFYLYLEKNKTMENLPKIVQKKPYLLDEKSGKKAFCSCGLSKKDPYCDGSHKGTGFSPEIVEITEDRKVAWCGCKNSKKGAFCDGSHKNL
tara:strand:- start:137 stop:493 length:357 start_codon:yes stop_codon:yes gene_type:complete